MSRWRSLLLSAAFGSRAVRSLAAYSEARFTVVYSVSCFFLFGWLYLGCLCCVANRGSQSLIPYATWAGDRLSARACALRLSHGSCQGKPRLSSVRALTGDLLPHPERLPQGEAWIIVSQAITAHPYGWSPTHQGVDCLHILIRVFVIPYVRVLVGQIDSGCAVLAWIPFPACLCRCNCSGFLPIG